LSCRCLKLALIFFNIVDYVQTFKDFSFIEIFFKT